MKHSVKWYWEFGTTSMTRINSYTITTIDQGKTCDKNDEQGIKNYTNIQTTSTLTFLLEVIRDTCNYKLKIYSVFFQHHGTAKRICF